MTATSNIKDRGISEQQARARRRLPGPFREQRMETGVIVSAPPGQAGKEFANFQNGFGDQRANLAFALLALNSYDALRVALAELLEQIECLGGIEFSKDLEPYKAEAVWDDAMGRAKDALALARGSK